MSTDFPGQPRGRGDTITMIDADEWFDPQLNRTVIGYRCKARAEEWGAQPFQCMREANHSGDHRFTSGADGRSISWS